MAEVRCSRCGNDAAGLAQAPMPGEVGQLILDQSCGACWKEWLRAQVILINENRLTPRNPEHYQRLVGEMKTFLALRDES